MAKRTGQQRSARSMSRRASRRKTMSCRSNRRIPIGAASRDCHDARRGWRVWMSVAVVSPRRWKKPPLIKSAWLRWTLAIGAAVYLALVLQTTPVNWTRVWEGLPRGAAFVSAFFPPDFVSRWDEIAEGIAESLWMTVVSTRSEERRVGKEGGYG